MKSTKEGPAGVATIFPVEESIPVSLSTRTSSMVSPCWSITTITLSLMAILLGQVPDSWNSWSLTKESFSSLEKECFSGDK